MLTYKRRNREDNTAHRESRFTAPHETELVLKLRKDELFDQHVLLPHAELNRIVYESVNNFVEKYPGADMTLLICTGAVSPVIQNLFREVYRSHYQDELYKVNGFLKRDTIRVIVLIIVSLAAFLLSGRLSQLNPHETLISYIIANVSVFCLWEVGYTHTSTHNVMGERRRLIRALNATIQFQ